MPLITKLLFVSLLSLTVFSQEIFLFDMVVTADGIILSGAKNITKHAGYDNQPSFHPDLPIVYYTSAIDSTNTDIKSYNFETGETKPFTSTKENEFSPTVTPDKKFISCNISAQGITEPRLGKFPASGGTPVILIKNLIVGYHGWIDNSSLLLFVLRDSITNDLHYYNLDTKFDTVIATGIGRSLKKIPGEAAMSYVDKSIPELWSIKRFDLRSRAITSIAPTLKGSEDFTWIENGTLLMSGGQKIFSLYPKGKEGWKPLTIEGESSMLKNVTRLAANPAHTKLAVVVGE